MTFQKHRRPKAGDVLCRELNSVMFYIVTRRYYSYINVSQTGHEPWYDEYSVDVYTSTSHKYSTQQGTIQDHGTRFERTHDGGVKFAELFLIDDETAEVVRFCAAMAKAEVQV